MYRSKREVDKFVQDLNEKNKNEEERGLKGFTVAKLYYQVGEYQPALTYLDKYDKYRTNSAASFKLRGQVYQALAQSATLDASEKTQLQNLALQSYRRSVESDLSQTDLLLTIAELMLNLPIEEQGKARYWLEEAEKIFPNNKTLKNLRLKIQRAKEGLGTEDTQSEEEGRGEVNGNGAHGNDSDDNSAFWSANTGGGSSFLNNSRLDMRAETTSTPRIGSGSLLANNQSRRFIPRPSPERLANQIKSVEVAQEKMLAVIHEQSKANHETNEAILHEIRTSSEHAQKFNKDLLDTQTALLCEIRGFRDESNRQIRDNTRALKDVKSELVSLCDDMMRQLKTLVAAMKASRDEVDEEKSKQAAATAKAPPPKPDLPDINDLLLQQWSRLPPVHQLAILQMQGHLAATEAGMLAAARSAAVLPHVMPSVQNLNVQQAQQVPVQANPLQQIPLAQPNVPFQQTQRPPASVFDMGLTGASSGGNPWPSSSPSPQFPLPSISQPVVSTPSSSSTPSKETSILKPSIIGTPVNKPATGPSTPASGAFNLNVVKSTPPVSAAPTIVNPTPIPAAVKVSEPNRNSPFSTFASSPFAPASNVTPKPAAPKTDTAHSEFFASLGAPHTPQTGFNFGVPSPAPNVVPKKDLAAFSFAGAAAEAAQRAAASEDQDGDASGAHDESVEHDPQFEPIIPLPELVQVKTGEEEEEELFGFKAKMYRYDPESKEWKERGVGKIKILKHPVKGTFRVLLRREQIFKIAANHFITKDIELKPMASSTTALCYYAMDFADEELKLEHLAVRFKLEETKDEFKKVFEECQEELRKKGTPVKKDDSTPVKTEAEKQKPQDVKKDLSSLEQFKPKTGSWECSGCLCLNGADVIVCPACQTAKPGHEEEAKKATSSGLSKFGGGPPSGGFNLSGSAGGVVSSTQSGFKFGVDATSTNAATANQGAGFTFGTPVTATKAPTTSAAVTAAPTSGFTFGTPVAQSTAGATTTTTTAPTSGFTFGGGAAAAAVKPSGFTFGKPAETKPAASPASGFTFGKPAETSTPQTSTLLPATTTPQSSFSFGKPVSPKPETTAPAEAKPSPFAAFSFGLKPAASSETEATESKGVDLSASKNLASFADLATSTGTGFGFGGTKSNFAFTGAGAPVFGQAGQKKDSTPNETGADDETPDDADHDPHFEPIIPLPELVQVKTGEEEEEELFGHKAKMYRYDPETKEWKERGVGKLKILKHPTKGTYRVLLRREQVHKIAANHMITKDIEIKPMSTSTTAICYYAMDFAEETLKLEHLAVRFKLEETLEQFKTVFKKCQEDLKTKSTPTKKDPSITEVAIDPCQGLKNKVEELTSNLDMFKPKTDSWECPGCLCRNNADVIKCPSCETPKPGLENATPKVDNVTPKAETPAQSQAMSIFGGKPDTSGSGFSFAAFAPPPAASIFGGTKIEEIKTTATANDDELSFENQSLKLNTAADAAPVAAKISNTKNMKILTFSGNTVGIEAAEAIGKALETHPEFQRAHWKDMFTGRMKTEIPPALKHLSRGIMAANAHLVELDLSDNAFGPIGAEGIVDLLKSPSCFTLQEIRLNNTGCGVTGGKLLAKTLLECYHNSGKKLALKVFVLGRSRQENEGAKALAQVFKLMGSLEEVVMPQNGIYHEGIAALSDAFANNPNLRILNMNDNTFTEKGAQALAKALPKMQQLYVLNLGDCLLKTQGAKLLANALKAGHSNLEELYLDSNEIRSEGGLAVVEAMANKFKLQKLKLDGNQFGSDGCGTILQKLKQIGKQQVMEEIEDDEEPDEDEDENVSVDRAQLATGEDDEEDEDEDDEEYEDEDDENEEEEESNIMFEGTCNFFERIPSENGETSEESSLGKVDLKILYDDDVYGARILATEHQPDDTPTQNGSDVVPQTICNHLIAIQTVLSPKDDFRKMEWSALDFSKDPPVYRHFAAQFDREELGQEFRDIFTEGKDLAEQSEILEQPDMNPEEMYYGQGGDYEEEES